MTSKLERDELTAYSAEPVGQAVDLLFIHHSCGGQWLAAEGAAEGGQSIYRSHPNGGGLRARLEAVGYRVHEASYGSRIGESTDLFDWLPKFRDQMDAVLRCDHQDQRRNDGGSNQVVLFKSCFPNNAFVGTGAKPGKPDGPDLTVGNAQAAYGALLDVFRSQPKVIFVAVTAPPLAPNEKPQPAWKQLARRLLGRESGRRRSGVWARQFNRWLSDPGGWLEHYPLKNVAVFDYYDVLTGHGRSDFSAYPTRNGFDSHPSAEGNRQATEQLVPWLNRVVRRSGVLG